MSSFTDPSPVLRALDTLQNGRGLFEVVRPFSFYVDHPGGEVYDIPVGYVTDLCSVPWWGSWFLPVAGPFTAPAVLHDYLLSETQLSYSRCHSIFRLALSVKRVGRFHSWLAYSFVKLRYPRRPSS